VSGGFDFDVGLVDGEFEVLLADAGKGEAEAGSVFVFPGGNGRANHARRGLASGGWGGKGCGVAGVRVHGGIGCVVGVIGFRC